MTITAQSIVSRANVILQDTTGSRWPVRELTRWFNDAQRQVALHRPDAKSATATYTCVAGTRQDIGAGAFASTNKPSKLMDIVRNMASSSQKRAVRLVAREIMDQQNPGWHSATQSVDIVHYIYDAREPRVFYVYPPANTSAQLEVMFSAYPTDVALPAEGVELPTSLSDTDTSVITGNLDLSDIYAGAVLDFILYRAYLKDADYAGNADRAQAHFMAFNTALGIEAQGLFNNGPNVNTSFNPNQAGGG